MKYPRTMNFSWSDSNSSDDVWWTDEDVSRLQGKEVVASEKLDGECTGMTRDHCHARSLDSKHHPSRSWVKALHARIAYQIPEGIKIFGENVFAWHSIFYTELPTYFFVYGIYDGNRCLSWDETEEMCELLELQTVPVIYRGLWDEKKIREISTDNGAFPTFNGPDDDPCNAEGYVVRVVDEFLYSEFRHKCAKMVRKNHVQTDQNWMTRQVIQNLLKS